MQPNDRPYRCSSPSHQATTVQPMFSKDNLEYSQLPLPDRDTLTDEEMLARVQEFHAFLKTRHSVRDYSTRPVAPEVIEACVAAGARPRLVQTTNLGILWRSAIRASSQQIRDAAEEEEPQVLRRRCQ